MKRSVEDEKECQDGPSGKRARTDSVASSGQQKCRPSQVPEYLHDSEFYKSLNIEDDEEFHIPANLMKENMSVDTLQDACDLLDTLRYWGSAASVSPVVLFAIAHPVEEIQPELSAFETEFPFLKSLFYILDEAHSAEKRMEAAMELGMIEVVRHLDKSVEGYTMRAIGLAAAGGHIDCLQHALKNTVEDTVLDDFEVYNGAVANGQLDAVELLDRHSQLSIERYLKLRQSRSWWHSHQPTLAAIAAEHGQLECLRYLHEKGCRLNRCLVPAALSGSMPCLQYVVRKRGHNFSGPLEDACIAAAEKGHIECLKYLHNHNFPLYKEACIAAAAAGSVECLVYAHQHYVKSTHTVVFPRRPLGYVGPARKYPVRRYHHGSSVSSRSGSSDHTKDSVLAPHHHSDSSESEYEDSEDGMIFEDVHSQGNGNGENGENGEGGSEEEEEEEVEVMMVEESSEHSNLVTADEGKGDSSSAAPLQHHAGRIMPQAVCIRAASVGSLECLQFFHENGGEWDFLVTHIAALHGQIEPVKPLPT